MDGFGPEKLIFILLILMLVFGAKRLPEIGQSLGKGIREFKKSIKGDFDESGQHPQATYQVPPQSQVYPPQYPPQQLQGGVAGAPVVQGTPLAPAAQQTVPVQPAQAGPEPTAPAQQDSTQA